MSRRFVLAALILLAAACGDGGVSPTTTDAGGAATAHPMTVEGVEIPARPQRIVSGSATHTEILYALGAGPEVVATDFFSNYPAEAESTAKVDAFSLNIEEVAAFDPDLVVLAFDPGGAVDALGALGIPTLLFDAPRDLEDVYGQIRVLGEATGNTTAATELVAGMRADIGEIVDALPEALGATYYHELDPGLYTVTSSTFIGSLYGFLGLENIADPADEDGFGYPQLSAEYLIDADPDFIFLADTVCCGVSAAAVADRPGWEALSAVVGDRVIELDDDVASRWGPRVVDFLRAVAEAIGERGS